MVTTSKYCKTLKQAERHQNSLYSKYPYVNLITFPTMSDEGLYIWEISM